MQISMCNVIAKSHSCAVVANTFTGSVLNIPIELATLLENQDAEALIPYLENHPDIKEICIKKGIVFEQPIDEAQNLLRLMKRSYDNAAVLTVEICPTLACNFRCPYCFEEHLNMKMDDVTAKATLSFIENHITPETKVLNIHWFGGEPTLEHTRVIELSRSLIALSKKHNVAYQAKMTTNGYLIDNKRIQDYKEAHIAYMNITLDGSEKTHNSRRKLINGNPTYERILNNIELLSKAGIGVYVRVNVDKTNYDEFEEVKQKVAHLPKVVVYSELIQDAAHHTQEEKAKHLHNSPKETDVRRYEGKDASLQAQLQKNVGCSAQSNASWLILPDGTLSYCGMDLTNPTTHFGSVFNTSTKPPSNLYSNDFILETDCKTCAYLPLCMGGCPRLYRQTGHPRCTRAKTLLPRLLSDLVNN